MPPLVLDTIHAFRADLLRNEEAAMRAAAQRWLGVENALRADIEVLAHQMAEQNVVSMGQLSRMRRYQALQGQIDQQLGKYAGYMEGRIIDGQRDMALRAISHAQATVQSIAVEAGVNVQFNRLPVSATEDLIGLAGDGSPLRTILDEASNGAGDALGDVLIRGTALGKNPIEVARQAMRLGLGRSFSRMQLISRTEQLRVLRTSTLRSYERSNIIAGYVRISARDRRVCPACLFADGRFYELSEGFDAHPACRCSLLPRLRNVAPTRFEDGQTWFTAQPAATQRAILGRGRYEAWRDGRASLDDLVTRQWDDTWGGALVPTLVRNLPRR